MVLGYALTINLAFIIWLGKVFNPPTNIGWVLVLKHAQFPYAFALGGESHFWARISHITFAISLGTEFRLLRKLALYIPSLD